ncbi:hypothetical protein GCM10023184_27490 [Flaviaesturariibacter amylovorans]|uniref:DUF4251 domain-containing protein n=2 Tax=Flaviaesturariibacter amylovorans TaxID=1084520 RepID=A0ABP8H3S5_9BACT
MSLLFLLPLMVFGQMDTLTRLRVDKVLAGFSNRFADIIKKEKLKGEPKRMYVMPGILGLYDELVIWSDTSYIYSCPVYQPVDTTEALCLVNTWDCYLEEILGEQFVRTASDFSFTSESGWPITYDYQSLRVAIGVSRHGNKGYLTWVAFSGTIPKKRLFTWPFRKKGSS